MGVHHIRGGGLGEGSGGWAQLDGLRLWSLRRSRRHCLCVPTLELRGGRAPNLLSHHRQYTLTEGLHERLLHHDILSKPRQTQVGEGELVLGVVDMPLCRPEVSS